MLDATRKFYELTRNAKAPAAPQPGEAAPTSHTRIFYKEYPRFETLSLPESPPQQATLAETWEARGSHREFSDVPLRLEDVSALLGSCGIMSAAEERERRTYPSAGARFPIESYLLAFRVEGLETGCYHYKVRSHELERMWPENLAERSDEIVSPFVSNPAAAIVMTSVLSRAEVKYRYKALPFSYLEAGHMAQNMLLAAAASGVGACPIGGFVDQTLVDLLDLTDGEIPVYVIAAGR